MYDYSLEPLCVHLPTRAHTAEAQAGRCCRDPCGSPPKLGFVQLVFPAVAPEEAGAAGCRYTRTPSRFVCFAGPGKPKRKLRILSALGHVAALLIDCQLPLSFWDHFSMRTKWSRSGGA